MRSILRHRPREHQAAGGGENAPGWSAHRIEMPDDIPGLRIKSDNAPAARFAAAHGAALIPLAFDEILRGLEVQHATLAGREIVKPGLRAVRGGLPIVAAAHSCPRSIPSIGLLLA